MKLSLLPTVAVLCMALTPSCKKADHTAAADIACLSAVSGTLLAVNRVLASVHVLTDTSIEFGTDAKALCNEVKQERFVAEMQAIRTVVAATMRVCNETSSEINNVANVATGTAMFINGEFLADAVVKKFCP